MMTSIETVLRQPAAQAVAWALLQFVWQGALAAAATGVALLALRRSAADIRYVVSTIGLAVMLTLPAVSGVQQYRARVGDDAQGAPGTSLALPAAIQMTHRGTTRAPRVAPAATREQGPTGLGAASGFDPEGVAPVLMLVWIVGVTMLSVRLLTGWIWVQRLRTHGAAPAHEGWQRMAARLSRRLHIGRAIALLESTLVDVPTVIGWLKPVVLLPASALAALSPGQVEAILAHELAHIRRHDYLVNLLQTLVETLLFYHPAVWWLSRRIRIERENCCDDLAVSLCGDPVAYASALADLEALRPAQSVFARRHEDQTVLAATGGSLLNRVRRLLGAPTAHSGRAPAWLAGCVALLLVGGIAVGADGLRGDQTPVVAVRATAAPSAAVASDDTERRVQPAVVATAPAAPVSAAVAAVAHAALAPAGLLASRPALAAASVSEAGPGAAAMVGVVAGGSSANGTAPHQDVSLHQHQDGGSGNWIWSNNGEKLEVTYSGTFDFTDDDADVSRISTGGSIKISDGAWFGRHSVEVRERGGQLEHHYYVNGSERPFEPEGRQWLHENLPKFVRNTGIGAPSRVARFLKAGGPSSVMAEIGRIDSTYVKGIYFRELFTQASLTPDQYRQAMQQASREMHSSDYELATLLLSIADRLPNDEASRASYFAAASGISSAYELRRVYATMLKKGPVGAPILAGILEHSASVHSDYELSELLRQIAGQQTLDDRSRDLFFKAAASIHSDYELHRVLAAAIQRNNDPATLEAALTRASGLSGDYEAGTFLAEVLKQSSVEGRLRAPFFAILNRIGGSYKRGRVLEAIIRQPGVSPETLRAVLQSGKGLANFELARLLVAVADAHTLTGDLRDAYLDAADKLSGYEQGQVMTALVKSERRK